MMPDKFINPVLADLFVQSIQYELEKIYWIKSVYPLVRKGMNNDGTSYPQVYKNDGSFDSFNILPDTEIASYCYFTLESDVVIGGDPQEEEQFFEIPLSLTIWGQLDKMIPKKKYDYTSELINDIIVTLRSLGNDATTRIQYVQDIHYSNEYNSLFGRYSYPEQEKQILMRKYTGFIVYFTVVTDEICMDIINY